MNKLLSGLFTLMIFGMLALSIWYVGARLQTLFGLQSRWPIQTAVAAAVTLAMLAIVAAVRSSSPLIGILNLAGGYLFTFYIFLLLALVCLHAIQLVRPLPMAGSGTAALAVALVITAAGALWANSFAVSETEIRLPGLKSEVNVMLISDMHLGYHNGRDYLEEIVQETNRRNPDLVIITGDLVSQHGVHVLHNEVALTNGLQLAGLDYMNADDTSFDMHPSDDPRTIKSVLPGLALKTDMPAVLLHHSPVGVKYAAEKGIDLMLSGHTHAGQLFPFNLFTELVFPFNRGLHQQDNTQVFVSQGAGTFMLRFRLGTSNEINLLRLVPGN